MKPLFLLSFGHAQGTLLVWSLTKAVISRCQARWLNRALPTQTSTEIRHRSIARKRLLGFLSAGECRWNLEICSLNPVLLGSSRSSASAEERDRALRPRPLPSPLASHGLKQWLRSLLPPPGPLACAAQPHLSRSEPEPPGGSPVHPCQRPPADFQQAATPW